MSDRDLIDRAALARKLGIEVETLYRDLPRMIATKRFPAPAWGNGRGARWDPVAIDRWLDAKLPDGTNSNAVPNTDGATTPGNVADLLAARAAKLARR
jgi:predicted DNA-binding transcriptional regulator AlpA